MCIAIIPARGGSKRVPGKNIRPLNGKPLIAWAIEACLASQLFTHVLVSTDDDSIASVAQHYGAVVPFKRPEELADDFVATTPVVAHALQWIRENWQYTGIYCQLYANPFITPANLQAGYQKLLQSDVSQVSAVTEFPYPILRAFELTESGSLQYRFPQYRLSRSQDLPVFYHDAGQFYWHNPASSNDCLAPLFIPRHLVVDIDTEEDFKIAEIMHKLFFTDKVYLQG